VSYLLHGLNALPIDERILTLRNELDPQGLNTTTLEVQQSTAGEISSACQSTPFFGGNRLVVLNRPLGSSQRGDVDGDDGDDDGHGRMRWADLHAILTALPPTTTVIVRHDGALAPGHYLHKAARSLGWTIEAFPIPDGAGLLAWVQERAGRAGADFEPQAARELLDRLYPTSWDVRNRQWATDTPDTRLIATEIDKLATAAAGGRITTELVLALVVDRAGFTAFRLNDVTFSGQTSAALVELQKVLEFGEPAERVLGQLASEAAVTASINLAAGLPPAEVAAKAGITESRLANLQRRPARVDRRAERRIAELLRAADAGMKAGEQRETAATIVPLVAEIAEATQRVGGERRGRR
jgi:DNA polymerase III delta subunit